MLTYNGDNGNAEGKFQKHDQVANLFALPLENRRKLVGNGWLFFVLRVESIVGGSS